MLSSINFFWGSPYTSEVLHIMIIGLIFFILIISSKFKVQLLLLIIKLRGSSNDFLTSASDAK